MLVGYVEEAGGGDFCAEGGEPLAKAALLELVFGKE